MKVPPGLISWTIILAAIVLGVPINAQDAVNSALIQGLVSRTTNGEPVEGVTVTAVSDSGSKYSMNTDSSGTFRFDGIPAGVYFLSASRSGFLPYDRDQYSTRVSVSPDQQLTGLRIQLTPTGVIAGRVLDSNRQPVAGAVVMAIRPTFINGRKVLVPDLANTGSFLPIGSKPTATWDYPKAIADDWGEYRIFGLAPGEYYVSVWTAGAETLDEATGGINKIPGDTKDQPPIYYPGVVDPGGSITVIVNGTERSGIDIELRRQSLHQVRFQVASSVSPQPCRGIGDAREAIVLIRRSEQVDVIQYSSRFGNTVFKKGEDSQWTSPPLPMGSYEIFFNPCMFNQRGMVGAITADIVDRDADAGQIVIPPNASISGRVQKTQAPSVAFDKLRILLRPLDLRSASTSMVPRPNPPVPGQYLVRGDGTFSYGIDTTAPGLYQIDVAGLPEDVYVASIELEEREVRDSGFRVDSGASGQLEITLSEQGGVVQGLVQDRFGMPAVDSFVALMPSNRELVYSNLFREIRTGQDGRFTIRGIPPGEYGMIAVGDLDAGESRSAEFRDKYESGILKVIIKQGSLETVSLTVESD